MHPLFSALSLFFAFSPSPAFSLCLRQYSCISRRRCLPLSMARIACTSQATYIAAAHRLITRPVARAMFDIVAHVCAGTPCHANSANCTDTAGFIHGSTITVTTSSLLSSQCCCHLSTGLCDTFLTVPVSSLLTLRVHASPIHASPIHASPRI